MTNGPRYCYERSLDNGETWEPVLEDELVASLRGVFFNPALVLGAIRAGHAVQAGQAVFRRSSQPAVSAGRGEGRRPG